MIVTANINGKPESNPGTKFGSHSDGANFYFFENDQERIDYMGALPQGAPELNWIGLKQSLFYSSLFQRAIAESQSINQTIFSALTTTLSDGLNGNAKEQTVLSLINKLGMTFSVQEKAELNGYFQANNFTIRL